MWRAFGPARRLDAAGWRIYNAVYFDTRPEI
jgi:hypothetical protein